MRQLLASLSGFPAATYPPLVYHTFLGTYTTLPALWLTLTKGKKLLRRHRRHAYHYSLPPRPFYFPLSHSSYLPLPTTAFHQQQQQTTL